MLNARIKFSLQNRLFVVASSVLSIIWSMRCTSDIPQSPPALPNPIELDFRALSTTEYAEFRRNTTYSDSTQRHPYADEVLWMSVKNNNYDSLFIDLSRFVNAYAYRSDVETGYSIQGDSLVPEYGDIRCFFGSDSTYCLLKGQAQSFYFNGVCSAITPYRKSNMDSTVVVKEYNFGFMADSLGKKRYPQFKQFPCATTLPKKKNKL